MKRSLDISLDYPLPNLYYFTSGTLKKIRAGLNKQVPFLNEAGFEESHFPFLIPQSILLNYKGLISFENFIKVYSGKDRRYYAYLRPDGIFSQGLTLAKRIIRSYRDLPLKLFEVSPGYIRTKIEKEPNILSSPEQSFSIQGGVFTENNDQLKFLQSLLSKILDSFSLAYETENTSFSGINSIKYFSRLSGEKVIVAKIFDFGQEVTKRANIYFFNNMGNSSFPYMYTLSLSQNIYLIKILRS